MAGIRVSHTEVEAVERFLALQDLARKLLLAMERMHGNIAFSANVCIARDELHAYLSGISPTKLDPADEAKAA